MRESAGSTLIRGIGEPRHLQRSGPDKLGLRRDAAVVVEAGRIAWVGASTSAPDADRSVDLGGRAVLPGRRLPLPPRLRRRPLAGVRRPHGGGALRRRRHRGLGRGHRQASDDELRALVAARVAEMRAQGTTTVEIKGGYGLTVEDEARALRIAAEFTTETTFLGAHVVPAEYSGDRAAYVDLVTGPCWRLRRRTLDGWTCSASRTRPTRSPRRRPAPSSWRVSSPDSGLRVHGNQLGPGPACSSPSSWAPPASTTAPTSPTPTSRPCRSAGTTVATLLPGVEFSTRSPYPDARRLLDAGVSVALATDCNPGTRYSSSMPFVIALAVREMGLTPGEAVYAATAGSAPRCAAATSAGSRSVRGPT